MGFESLFDIQNAVMAELEDGTGAATYDTDYPDVADEPTKNGVLVPYLVVRSNSPNRVPTGGSFGGNRWDEMYTLIDVLAVAASPEECRRLAYGEDGVTDTLVGFKPGDDAGTLGLTGGGMVFVASDGTNSKPSRFISRVSFRCQVNLTPGT